MKVRIQRYVTCDGWHDMPEYTSEATERRARSVLVDPAGIPYSFSLKTGGDLGARGYRIHPDDLAAVRALPEAGKAPKPDPIAEARAAGARDERAAIREEAMNRARAHADRGETGAAGALVLLASWIDGRTT